MGDKKPPLKRHHPASLLVVEIAGRGGSYFPIISFCDEFTQNWIDFSLNCFPADTKITMHDATVEEISVPGGKNWTPWTVERTCTALLLTQTPRFDQDGELLPNAKS